MTGLDPASAGIMTAGSIVSNFMNNSASAKAAKRQYQYNLKLQKQAQDWNEYMYKNRYQMEKADKLAAGLNQLYGLSNAPSVTSGMNSTSLGEDVAEANGRKQRIIEAIQTATDMQAKKVAMDKMKQETKTEELNTIFQGLKNIRQQIDNKLGQKQLDWYDRKQLKELQKTESEIKKNAADAVKSYASAEKDRADAESARSMKLKTDAETYGIKNDNAVKETKLRYWEENPDAYYIEKGVQEMGGGIIGNTVGGLLGSGRYAKANVRRQIERIRRANARERANRR